MYNHFRWKIFNNFVGNKIVAWRFVVYQFFIMHIISAGEVSFTERAKGNVDWRDSITVGICSVGVEMRCDLNTPDSSPARIFAFSLSVVASESSG
jgi:hypothetical protein